MNLDEYLKGEKEKLEIEKIRLNTIENERSSSRQNEEILSVNEIKMPNAVKESPAAAPVNDAHQLTSETYKAVESSIACGIDFPCPVVDLLKLRNEEISSVNSRAGSSSDGRQLQLPRCNRIKAKSSTKRAATADFSDSSNAASDSILSKVEKECANARRSGGARARPTPDKDDMEEWVSDTFYSYFPSFNILDKKRENLAKDRQQDYQNYLKKISAQESKPKRNPSKKEDLPQKIIKPDKSETEIIVNNPSVANDASIEADITRPGSTKHKLLQDLKHTTLSNIVNGDGVFDRNRVIAENENKKKLEYQKQLMTQIEEKRKEIEELKARERLEEELLTKKLEEQLKTMQLEDDLEKERIRVEKARVANEQNQALRSKLLAKLDNDKKLLQKRETQSENGKENIPNQDNKVYKYFSNSARRNEYNKYDSQNVFNTNESDPPPPQLLPIEPNLSKRALLSTVESSCSFCNTKLKTTKCLNCECKLFENDSQQSHSMLCESCQGEFYICSSCERKNTPCLFCHRRRSVCTDCIRNFCPYCGNVTRNPTPIVTSRSFPIESGRRSKASSIRSFKVLDISYEESDDDSYQDVNYKVSGRSPKPYSMNIEKNSIFHPDNKIIEPKYEINIRNGEIVSHQLAEENADIFLVGQKTNERLSRYLKNYGDLSGRTSKTQSTQTGKDVERAETSPSIPLLRQPAKVKVLKIEERPSTTKPESEKIKNLSQKWEIPAVQKNIISTSLPRVLTQLGAVRKQLQIEQMELDVVDKKP